MPKSDDNFVDLERGLHTDHYKQEIFKPIEMKEPIQHKKLMGRILKIAKPEIPFLIIGCLGALLAGASYPAFAILFGDIYGVR